nr:hypothetical protein [Tanacetum cinerariifolium]
MALLEGECTLEGKGLKSQLFADLTGKKAANISEIGIETRPNLKYYGGAALKIHLREADPSSVEGKGLKSQLFADLTGKKAANISEIGIETRPNLKYYGGAALKMYVFLMILLISLNPKNQSQP